MHERKREQENGDSPLRSGRGRYVYDYPRPQVTTDIALFAGRGDGRQVLLIRRRNDPFKGLWALPGGHLGERETLEACAARELAEETGVQGVPLRQVLAASDPDRDPRARTITVLFTGEVPAPVAAKGADDAAEARWFPLSGLPPLAFDHADLIAAATQQQRTQMNADERR